jgi:hypothetical protein
VRRDDALTRASGSTETCLQGLRAELAGDQIQERRAQFGLRSVFDRGDRVVGVGLVGLRERHALHGVLAAATSVT